MCSHSANRGLVEEARRLRQEGEAGRRRQEAKVVRADWKAESIAKKFREPVESRTN
jgi:hypothetical protein